MSNEKRPSLSERVSQFPQNLLTPRFLMMAGIAGSVVLILEGFICFSVCFLNVRSYVLSFYYILFGLISIAAELKFNVIYRNAKIIHSKTGRGLWYIFLGTLALGREWWGYLCALALILLGILNIVAVCKGEDSSSKNDQGEDIELCEPQTVHLAQNAKPVSAVEDVQPLAKAYDSENQIAPLQSAYDDY